MNNAQIIILFFGILCISATLCRKQKSTQFPFPGNHVLFMFIVFLSEEAHPAWSASFFARRYTQYWFMLIPSRCECSASERCRLRGRRSLNCPE